MIKHFFICFCLSFFLLPTCLLSLDSLDHRLLYRATVLPPRAEMNLQAIADSLATFTKDEAQKAEIAFYWISEHIRYDFSDEAETAEVLDLNKVILAQKANVQTFSQLYRELCVMMGLTCHIVPGYVRLRLDKTNEFTDYTDRQLELPERPHHTWNAVKLNGLYYFVDVSMASGSVNGFGEETVFVRKYDLDHVLVNGNPFMRTHLPADPCWQLRDHLILLETFYSNRSFEMMEQLHLDYPEIYDYQDAIARYEKANQEEQRFMRLQSSFLFYPSPFNLRELADATYGMAYARSQKDYTSQDMIDARLYYNKAIELYEDLEQTPMVKTLIAQAQQGVTYVNYRLEHKQ